MLRIHESALYILQSAGIAQGKCIKVPTSPQTPVRDTYKISIAIILRNREVIKPRVCTRMRPYDMM